MNDWLILIAIFVSVLLVAFTAFNYVASRREMRQNIERAKTHSSNARREHVQRNLDQFLSDENETTRYFFDVMRQDSPQSLRARLIRAGYFSRRGVFWFNLIRFIVAGVIFVAVYALLASQAQSLRPLLSLTLSAAFSGSAFILVNVWLDRLGKAKEVEYRKLFPDFMDLLIVCVDAGLGIDAALDRVAREYLVTNPDFGTHLSIVVLELRAGRPLHEALANLSSRINLEEARALATLFRQSVQLGASVGKTLRVFSAEMRTLRIVRAEEKANALPVKMLFPLAAFLFPVNLVIVLVPVMLSILKMFLSLNPPG